MRPLNPDSVVWRLGRRIAELRVQRGLSQERLAELAKVTPRYVQLLERGKQNVTLKTAVRFANLLKVGLDELFAKPTGIRTRVRARPARRRS